MGGHIVVSSDAQVFNLSKARSFHCVLLKTGEADDNTRLYFSLSLSLCYRKLRSWLQVNFKNYPLLAKA